MIRAAMARQSWVTYVRAAALSRGNFVLLTAGAVSAILLPELRELVAATLCGAELLYLGGLTLAPPYRALVEGTSRNSRTLAMKTTAQGRFQDVVTQLSGDRNKRFETVRGRCAALKEAVSGGDAMLNAVAKEQLAFVDKLLWVFVKLLDTEQNLERFLSGVSERDLSKEIQKSKDRLEQLLPRGKDDLEDRKRDTLDDTLKTLQQRRANVGRARLNLELVEFEIQRIEQKLIVIAELAVNRQDPAALTAEVDAMADSVRATEETIGELSVFVAMESDLQVPRILVEDKLAVRRG